MYCDVVVFYVFERTSSVMILYTILAGQKMGL